MANFEDIIDGFACGNNLDVERQVGNLPAGQTVVIAWLYVKHDLSDADADALFEKRITTTSSAAGQITADGTGGVPGVVLFHLLPADTAQLVDSKFFEVRVQLANQAQYTTNLGTIRGEDSIISSAT